MTWEEKNVPWKGDTNSFFNYCKGSSFVRKKEHIDPGPRFPIWVLVCLV